MSNGEQIANRQTKNPRLDFCIARIKRQSLANYFERYKRFYN